MKQRQLITRRRMKWAGTCVCIAIVLAGVISGKVGFGVKGTSASQWLVQQHVACIEGLLVFYRSTNLEQDVHDLQYGVITDWRRTYRLDPQWQSGAITIATMRTQYLHIPLWIPLLVVGVPTLWLWRADRRAKAHECRTCRYDLRGLAGNVCPECGNSAERAS